MSDQQKKSRGQSFMQRMESFTNDQLKWLNRFFNEEQDAGRSDDWVTGAEWARINQQPLRARSLLYSIIVTFFALIVWAALAPLDEIARGDGKVIPSQRLQTLQSLDGGLVKEILVREGQIVAAGEILIKVDPTRFIASYAESRSQFSSLSAEVARLQALVTGENPVFPNETVENEELLQREMRLYQSSLEELEKQQQVYSNQITQRQQEFNEANAAVTQHSKTLELTQHEIEITRPLLESGAVSDIDILRLERDIVRIQGELSRAQATKARSASAIKETENKKREVELTLTNRWRGQLADSASKLNALTKAEEGLADKVLQADIRSPIRGTVQRLYVHTVGGVLTPGREVIEIVPLDDKLVIEARIPPKDIAFIKPGQKATLRFSAYDFSVYGGVKASVSHISADTITDDKDNTYYSVRLVTEYSALNKDLLIIPGMTAQVDIITGKRTVLKYLLKPLLRASATALSER